jgi:hypothetical protein
MSSSSLRGYFKCLERYGIAAADVIKRVEER